MSQIFWWGCFAPTRLLHPGTTVPSPSVVTPLVHPIHLPHHKSLRCCGQCQCSDRCRLMIDCTHTVAEFVDIWRRLVLDSVIVISVCKVCFTESLEVIQLLFGASFWQLCIQKVLFIFLSVCSKLASYFCIFFVVVSLVVSSWNDAIKIV